MLQAELKEQNIHNKTQIIRFFFSNIFIFITSLVQKIRQKSTLRFIKKFSNKLFTSKPHLKRKFITFSILMQNIKSENKQH